MPTPLQKPTDLASAKDFYGQLSQLGIGSSNGQFAPDQMLKNLSVYESDPSSAQGGAGYKQALDYSSKFLSQVNDAAQHDANNLNTEAQNLANIFDLSSADDRTKTAVNDPNGSAQKRLSAYNAAVDAYNANSTYQLAGVSPFQAPTFSNQNGYLMPGTAAPNPTTTPPTSAGSPSNGNLTMTNPKTGQSVTVASADAQKYADQGYALTAAGGSSSASASTSTSTIVPDDRAPAGWGIDTATGHFAKLPGTDTATPPPLPANPLTISSSDLTNPDTSITTPTGSVPSVGSPTDDGSASGGSTGAVGAGGTAGAGGQYSTTQPISGPSEFQALASQLGVNGTSVPESQYFTRKHNDATGVDDIYLNEAGAVKLATIRGTTGSISTGTGVNIPTAGLSGQTIVLPDGTKFQIPDLNSTYQSILAGLNPEAYTQKLQDYQDTYLKPIYDQLQQNEDQINASLDAIVARKGLDRDNAANFFMTAASLASVTSADTQPLEDLISVLDQKRQLAVDTLSMREDDLGRYAQGLQFQTQTQEEALTLAMTATQNVYSQIQAYSSAYSAMMDSQTPKQTGEHFDYNSGQLIPDYSVWDPTSKSWVPYTGGSSSGSSSGDSSGSSSGSSSSSSSSTGTVDASSLSDAIKAQESGGSYTVFGDNGTSYGAYQFKAPTWNTVYSEYAQATGAPAAVPKWGTSAMTPQIQDAVAQWKMGDLMSKGNSASDVANIWNSSLGGKETPQNNSAVQYANQVMGRLGNTVTTTDASGTSVRSAATSVSGYVSYAKAVQDAPVLIQNAIKELPDGTPYIDGSLLTSNGAPSVANYYSSQTGIRVLSAADASDLDAIRTATANLATKGNLFGNLAASDSSSSPADALTHPDLLGSAQGKVFLQNFGDPLNALFNTPRGQALKTYDASTAGVYNLISSLAGSHPRVTGFEFANAQNYLPSTKDTLMEGAKKLVSVQANLDNSIRTYIPNYVGTPVQVGTQWAVGDANQNIKLFSSESAAYDALASLNAPPGKTNVVADTNKGVMQQIGTALQNFKATVVGVIKPVAQVVQVALGKTTATVNASIASRLKAADADYYKNTGKHIAVGESFRTPQHQTDLYKKLSKKGAQVAPPGYSFHQIGMAIDVGNNWKSYQPYLEKYGFKNELANDRGHFSIGEFS